jgi:hypothetical protein
MLEFQKINNMNVHIYEGNDRLSANVSLIAGNKPPKVGQTYVLIPDRGALIVAYPDKDVDTEFQFKYWL